MVHCQPRNKSSTQSKAIATSRRTFEQPGVKAPGTPKRIPFFPLKTSVSFTFLSGAPSCNSISGRGLPCCATSQSITAQFQWHRTASNSQVGWYLACIDRIHAILSIWAYLCHVVGLQVWTYIDWCDVIKLVLRSRMCVWRTDYDLYSWTPAAGAQGIRNRC